MLPTCSDPFVAIIVTFAVFVATPLSMILGIAIVIRLVTR